MGMAKAWHRDASGSSHCRSRTTKGQERAAAVATAAAVSWKWEYDTRCVRQGWEDYWGAGGTRLDQLQQRTKGLIYANIFNDFLYNFAPMPYGTEETIASFNRETEWIILVLCMSISGDEKDGRWRRRVTTNR